MTDNREQAQPTRPIVPIEDWVPHLPHDHAVFMNRRAVPTYTEEEPGQQREQFGDEPGESGEAIGELTDEQRQLWNKLGWASRGLPESNAGQTAEQAMNLGVLEVGYIYKFEGVEPPDDATVRALLEGRRR